MASELPQSRQLDGFCLLKQVGGCCLFAGCTPSRLCSGNKTVEQTVVIQHPRNDVTDLYLHANDLRNFFFKVTKQSKTTPLGTLSSSRDEKIIRDIFGVFSVAVLFIRQHCRQLVLVASLHPVLLQLGFTPFTYWNISLDYDNLLHTRPSPVHHPYCA